MNATSADAVTTAMPAAGARPMAVSSGYAANRGSFIHIGAALIGWALLALGTVLGVLTAIDLPGIIFLQWSPSQWGDGPSPGLIRMMMGVGTFVLMLAASGFLMGGRRPHGVAHGLRAVAAVMAVAVCVCFIYGAFSSRGGLRASEERAAGGQRHVPQGQVVEQYINDMELGFLIPAGGAALAAATLLGWPAKRQHPLTAAKA